MDFVGSRFHSFGRMQANVSEYKIVGIAACETKSGWNAYDESRAGIRPGDGSMPGKCGRMGGRISWIEKIVCTLDNAYLLTYLLTCVCDTNGTAGCICAGDVADGSVW